VSDGLELADTFTHGSWAIHKAIVDTLELSDATSTFAQHLRRTLTAESLLLQDLAPGRVVTRGMFRRTLLESLILNDAAPIFASSLVKVDTVNLVDAVVHGRWLVARTLSERLRLADTFSTDLYGPFYGTLTLHQLPTDLDLTQLLSTLTLAQLRAVLTLSEEP
jgi:hypothetical protein